MRARAALTLLSAVWLLPPSVLPVPSRSGPDGPPRPFGFQPPSGPAPPRTDRALVRAQNKALLRGPFPRSGLARGVSDGTLLLSAKASVRELALARIAAAGATVVRIPVNWRDVAPAAPPAGFQADDPASPGYDFARIDAAVIAAAAAHLEPMLVVSHAPALAEAPQRWPFAYPGSWAPSPAALGAFAAALARRYDGSFPAPGALGGALNAPSDVLPRVRLFQAWNEPNLPRYLEPQWVARGRRWSAFSPLLYRQMLNAFYVGVKSVAGSDTVVAAGIAPTGDPVGVGRMAPLPFLRSMLCLGSPCSQPPHFDVLAFHPLSVVDPDVPAPSAGDVSISDAAKVTALLRRAERLHTVLPAGPKPVWVTELNWQSAPQSPGGVPPRLQALWVSRALHRLWVAGVQLVDWQFLIDPYPSLRLTSPTGATLELARPAGLYLPGPGGNPALAHPKTFLTGFTLPFDPLRVDRAHLRVWALLTRSGASAQLQRGSRAGRWRTILRLRADSHGVLNALVALRGGAHLRLHSETLDSAAAFVGPRRSF